MRDGLEGKLKKELADVKRFSHRAAQRLAASSCLLLAVTVPNAATFEERFESDPAGRWKTFGNEDLFHWNSSVAALDVSWDSSQPNSYFYRPLGTILSRMDDAEVSFDLRLDELSAGVSPGKPFTFELAVGLLNLVSATEAGFRRGTAGHSPNLMEFDYFPDTGFGATVSPVIVSSNNLFVPSFTFPLELTLGDQFHIEMRYDAASGTLTTLMQRNREPFGPIKPVVLGATFTDFRVDAFAIASYNDAGSDGSVRARGQVDNVVVTTPEPPRPIIQTLAHHGRWTAVASTHTNWVYSLERTDDWKTWRAVSARVAGTGGDIELGDYASDQPAHAWYRVRGERP